MIWKRVFEGVKWRGRKWTHMEKFWKCFLLSKYWIPLFQKRETFRAFLPLFFFYASFSLCFISLLRMNLGIFEMFEEKIIFFQTFFQMGWKWPHQDLWNWGSWGKFIDDGCIPQNGLMHANSFLFVRLAAKLCEGKIFWKIQKLSSLNKAQQEQELLCGIYLALVGMYMLLRFLSNSTLNNFIIEARQNRH
jgi:hypothetical protein